MVSVLTGFTLPAGQRGFKANRQLGQYGSNACFLLTYVRTQLTRQTAAYRMGNNLHQPHIRQGADLRNIQRTQQIDHQKDK